MPISGTAAAKQIKEIVDQYESGLISYEEMIHAIHLLAHHLATQAGIQLHA